MNIGSEVDQLLDNIWVLRHGDCTGMSCSLGRLSRVRETIYSKVPSSAGCFGIPRSSQNVTQRTFEMERNQDPNLAVPSS